MLKKFIQIFIFAGFWLCFVPWLVIILQNQGVLNPVGIMDYFIQYTTLLFVLIIAYWLINRLVDHCYMRHEIKKRVRKITIQRQLERLRSGEIDIEEAQNLKIFTKANKPKSPKTKRAASPASAKKTKPQEMKLLQTNKTEKPNKSGKSIKEAKNKAPAEPVTTELPPAYNDEMVLLKE